MDSKESLQSLNRDGSSDEDGNLSVTAGMAKEASILFQSRRYQECLDALNQLLQKKDGDLKVVHNIAITEYFHNGCSDLKKLLEVLKRAKRRSDDLAPSSGEQVEANNLGGSAVSGSKGSNSCANQFTATATTDAHIDDYDTSIATFNIAVIFYHLKDYPTALSVLEPLYQNIEPIDEPTALHICLLLLDVALASQDASKAADVIYYLEKAFGFGYMINQGDGGSSSQQQLSNQVPKASSTPTTNLVAVDSNSDSNVTGNASEGTLARTLSDETLDYENLLSTLDISGQNLSRTSSGLPFSTDLARASLERSAPANDLKLKLHLYKVRLLLLTRNLKATKREVKLAMNIARGRDSSTALLLKSQLEYARGNHRKAIKLLMTSSNRTESGMPSMFYNNLGCIYHQLKKHQTSTLFFSKALASCSSIRSEKPPKLATLMQDTSCLIVYNCGLQYLTCGKPTVAAHCFHKALKVFYNRSLLWLRLSECCIMAAEKSGEEVKVHVVGGGKWRQVIVEDILSRGRKQDILSVNGVKDDDTCKLSMPFARQCLLNALHLLDGLDSKCTKRTASMSVAEEDESSSSSSKNISNHKNTASGGDFKSLNQLSQTGANGDPKESKGIASSNATIQSSVHAYEDLCRNENFLIRQAVLADLAFVELALENPLKALGFSKALLQLDICSNIYVYLGHVYAAEALCRLNRLEEASEHLRVYVTGESNMELPFSDEDCRKWRNEKVGVDGDEPNGFANAKTTPPNANAPDISHPTSEEARLALAVNLVAMSAMLGDLDKASHHANEALLMAPSDPSAVLASVYVELLHGKSQDALNKLKQIRPVRFLPVNVMSSNNP
ncbi:hypothetical protein AMTRI_Chr13g89230 [Amborella trichopoda]